MNVNQERIKRLQQEMQAAGIDMYVVPTADFHQSEYVGDYFKVRAWLWLSGPGPRQERPGI